jgi:aryl-phospho-beta-D-glucosidase BglC (GH1 family)
MKQNLLFLSSLFCSLSLARVNMFYHTYQQECLNFVKNTAEWVKCYKNTFNLGNHLTQEQFLNAWRHFNVDCSSGFYNRNRALRSVQSPGLKGFICADELTAKIT